LVFLDADTLVVDKVLEEDFISNKPLFGVWHPCHNMGMPPHNKIPGAFETNPLSLACVDVSIDNYPLVYYQGCLWGGSVLQVMNMISILRNNIDEDLKNGIVARWHDESHLNKFFADNYQNVFTHDVGFCYPECMKGMLPVEPKIMHIDKSMKDFPRFEGV